MAEPKPEVFGTIDRGREATRRKGQARALVAAAATLAATGLWWVGIRDERADQFATGLAEREVALLDDGSRLELNAQTSVTVRLGRAERRVNLERGEALFTVAKDPARPFVVDTAAGAMRAAGTVFNVRTAAASGRVEVTVLEGGVRVRTKTGAVAAEASLAPGEQAWLEGSAGTVSVRRLPEGAAEEVAAWRNGQVAFHDTPLREAIERFAAYHAREIVVEPSAAELRLGGRFALNDLNGMLDAVSRVLPVVIVREGGGVVRIKGT